VNLRAWLLALLPLVAGLLFFAAERPAADATAPLSAYEPGYDGASSLPALVRESGRSSASLATSFRRLTESGPPDGVVLILMGVPLPPSDEDRSALRDFVIEGGSVLVMDDVGYANDLAAGHGVFYHRIELRDARFLRNQSLIPTTLHLPQGDFPLVLNAPTGLAASPNASLETWASSGNGSFLDLNGDRTIGVEDRPGPVDLALATEPNARGGRWVFLADADAFTDGTFGFAPENRDAFLALLETIGPGRGRVVFDERHKVPPGAEAALQSGTSTLEGAASSLPGRLLLLLSPLLAWPLVRRLPTPETTRHRHDLGAPRPGAGPTAGELRKALAAGGAAVDRPDAPHR
jgi:hypothetical protein